MTTLPYDVWRQVVAYSEKSECRTLRRVNTQLRFLATVELFSIIYLRPTMTSFRHAVAITESSNLCHHVLRLAILNEGINDDKLTREGFEGYADHNLRGIQSQLHHTSLYSHNDLRYENVKVRLTPRHAWYESKCVSKVAQLASYLPRLRELVGTGSTQDSTARYYGDDDSWVLRYGVP